MVLLGQPAHRRDLDHRADLLTEVEESLRRVLALASELGADTAEIRTELADDPVTASYQAAALTPVSALDDYALLTASGPADRLRLCVEMLGDTTEQLNRRLSE